jgi:7-carboxy-7-deazaguanine synthase
MYQGSLCTFLRLQGCGLLCTYCDTLYAQGKGGKKMPVKEVFEAVNELKNKNVTITGGEPLLQLEELAKLCLLLVNNGNRVSIETNGSIQLPVDLIDDAEYEVWKYINWVVDYKLSSSGMEDKMFMENFTDYDYASNDFIKFVIADSEDFRKAKKVIKSVASPYVKFAMSPVAGKLTAKELYKWMSHVDCLKERGVILNLQLHKILNLK